MYGTCIVKYIMDGSHGWMFVFVSLPGGVTRQNRKARYYMPKEYHLTKHHFANHCKPGRFLWWWIVMSHGMRWYMKMVIYGGTIVYHWYPLYYTPAHPWKIRLPQKNKKACFPTIHFSGDMLNIGGVTNQTSCQLWIEVEVSGAFNLAPSWGEGLIKFIPQNWMSLLPCFTSGCIALHKVGPLQSLQMDLQLITPINGWKQMGN